jgi:short-subunit dehydrogenase
MKQKREKYIMSKIRKLNILVTGASRGIGRAVVAYYAAAGASVVAIARRAPSETANSPGNIRWIEADLSTTEGCAKVVRTVKKEGIKLDVLINNAGMQQTIDFTSGSDASREIEAELALNLQAPAILSRALLPSIQQPGGTIVNVTSLVSRQPKPSTPIYSASKAGLASLSKSLRHQLQPLGINVVEVVPPLVKTDMTAGRGKVKLTAEAMAKAIVNGIEQRCAYIAPGMSRCVLALNRVVPELLERVLRAS